MTGVIYYAVAQLWNRCILSAFRGFIVGTNMVTKIHVIADGLRRPTVLQQLTLKGAMALFPVLAACVVGLD